MWQDSRYYAGNDLSINDLVLRIQKIALNECLAADVLERVENQELQGSPDGKPLKIAEIFRSLTDGIFTELKTPPSGTAPCAISAIRRNLEREYVKRLSGMVLGPKNDRFSGYGFIVFSGGGKGDLRSWHPRSKPEQND